MKIAFIVDVFPSLSETFILNQITGLIDLGHEVEIFAGTRSDQEKAHPEVEKYDLLSHTHLLHDKPGNRLARIIKACCLLVSRGYKNPLAILRSLDFLRFGKEALSLNLFYKAMLFLRNDNFDIIHCHFGPNGIMWALLKDIGIRGKLVTTFHAYDINKYIKLKGEDVYDNLFIKGDLFLPISHFWRKRLIELGCPPKRTVVHHMGVDLDRFQFNPRRLSSDEKVNILTIARLAEKKGLEYSIRAVAKVMETHPDMEYNIVGDGPLWDQLINLINKLDVRGQIRLLGWKVGEEIELLLKRAHLYILSSVTDAEGNMEGIPVSLMEAMAVGLPVISTFHSGIPELVENGESGFLVPEKDIDAMAEKLEYLVGKCALWGEMGREGRRQVEENFNIKKLNQRLIKIYQEIIQ